MKNLSQLVHDEYRFSGIEEFTDNLPSRKCVHYASEFLKVEENQLRQMESRVQHTIEIFKTLHLPLEEHFYPVFRNNSTCLFKDWRVSELACVYMMIDGDPTDLNTIARQQTRLIGQILEYQLMVFSKF